MEAPAKPSAHFTTAKLPWLVAAGALLLYLITLNHWVTLGSLPVVAKLTGWDWWTPALARPLLHLATWPIRCLPASAQLVGYNVFSAVCAALTLALLARSVSLLPHDRTRDQRQRERSANALLSLKTNWLPPLLAVLICGLQLTFWENAVTATGEVLDLLLFAYCVRAVLEFRLSQNDTWLAKLALVFGLAVTGNWAMLGFFPCFVAALVWVKGRSFFQTKFLTRIALCGIAGLLLYLVAPWLRANEHAGTYGQLLRHDLATQKMWLLGFPRSRMLLLALTSLLPVFVLSLRWPTNVGDASPLGVAVTNFMFRVMHAVFLIGCGCVAFDPVFSPRALGYGLPFLPFYWLGALAVGYFSGYFLLVCGTPPEAQWERPSAIVKGLNSLVVIAISLAFLVVPGALWKKNFPIIHAQNSPALRQFAEQLAHSLPTTGAIVLSDTPTRLQLLAAAQHGQMLPHLLVDVRGLTQITYHRQLAAHYPGRWPAPEANIPATTPVQIPLLNQYLAARAATNEVYYLQPTFGNSVLENLHLEPHGFAYRAVPYQSKNITPPPLAQATISATEQHWSQLAPQFDALHSAAVTAAFDSATLAGWYSVALNGWGVDLQRLGKLTEAGERFAQARALNTNPIAALNLQANQLLRANRSAAVTNAPDLLAAQRSWGAVLNNYGPFDESEYCFQLGRAYRLAGLRRQATIELLRAQTLNPTHVAVRLALVETYLDVRLADLALAALQDLRATPALATALKENEVALVRFEAKAQTQKTNFVVAEKILLTARQQYPKDLMLFETLFETYLQARQPTNALATVEQQLQLAPENRRALLNKGAICLELKLPDPALAALNQLLKQEPNHIPALINRAQVLSSIGKLEDAQRDYESVIRFDPKLAQGPLGLAEIALLRKNTGDAIRYFEAGQKLIPFGSPQAGYVAQKLKSLRAEKP